MQMDAETEARENADLTVYLNDHLSGAAAGLQLARSLRDNHEGTDLGEHMRELAAAIDEDRELLASLIDQIGEEKNPAGSGRRFRPFLACAKFEPVRCRAPAHPPWHGSSASMCLAGSSRESACSGEH